MSDPYVPDGHPVIAFPIFNSTQAVIALLPMLQQLDRESREHNMISQDTVNSIRTFLDTTMAQGIAVAEFMEWAVANAPFPLVSNMARVGLLV